MILLVVVTIVQVVFTMLMNKIEYEKKVKFIVQKLSQLMEDNAVLAD